MTEPDIQLLLKQTAERKGCKVEDLQWKHDKYGNVHVRLRCESPKK